MPSTTKKQAPPTPAGVCYIDRTALLPPSLCPKGAQVVALHFREASSASPSLAPFTTITLASPHAAVVVLYLQPALSATRVQMQLRALLADENVLKVVFLSTPTLRLVHEWFGGSVKIANIVDLGFVSELVPRDSALVALVQRCRAASGTFYDAMVQQEKKDPKAWSQPILARSLLYYTAWQANTYVESYAALAKTETQGTGADGSKQLHVVAQLLQRTARSWQSANDRAASARISSHTSVATKPATPATPAKKDKLKAPVSAVSSQVLPPPGGSSTSSSSGSDKSDADWKLTTYVNTTAALNQLVQERGGRLLDPSVFPVVAVHFHVEQPIADASESALGTEFVSHHRQSPRRVTDTTELLAISLTGLPVACCGPFSGDSATTLQQQLHSTVLHFVPTLDQSLALSLVATLLEDTAAVKIVHSVHTAAFVLSTLAPLICVAKCVDLQLAFEHTVGASGRQADVATIARHCGVPVETAFRDAVDSRVGKELLARSASTLQRLRNRTVVLLNCYRTMFGSRRELALLTHTTARRWAHAVANRGVPSVWFDATQDYAARSFESLETLDEVERSDRMATRRPGAAESALASSATVSSCLPPAPRLACDLEPLLALLPDKFRLAIVAIDGFHDTLVDICLDVGRLPHVYVGKGQRISLVCATDGTASAVTAGDDTVTKADVEEVLANLGGPHKIGFDNRAGIDRQLHRVSVMRSKTGEVYGLTLRVGRALEHAANVLQDVLMSTQHRDKSVLLLGRPGCGKTTLIRDVARSIAATRENVCIIDTSNEIGGDGLVPHACVGWARRMMVPSLEEQASVMIECVQNHTVETLVIDEIGRRAEVLAAATVRQRGPRLIASGHGDFRSLLKNPDLKGLVGGVQQVTVGDAAAAKSAHGNKLQAERAGAPIFDIVVELDHVERGHCRIIWDAGAAVDAVLRGEEFVCEVRQQDLSVRGILVPCQ